MKRIESRENARFQALRRLATSARERRDQGATVLEGTHLVCELFQAGGVAQAAYCTESWSHSAAGRELVGRTPEWPWFILPEALMRAASQLETGAGVVAVAAVPRAGPPPPLAGDALLIDRLQDPGNLGSILRSAAAAGIRTVYCAQATAAAWSPKVLRAAMGAHFRLELHEGVDLARLIAAATVPVRVTSSHAEHSLYALDLRAPCAWIFGNEGEGVDPELARSAERVAIPQPGGLESLNVAAAAAVCLFEQVRQRGMRRA